MPVGTKILVTGGAGFIGSHLVEQLARCGYEVTVVDQAPFETSCLAALGLVGHASVTCVKGSVTDETLWARLARDFQYVVHTAAVLGIERVVREQIETMDVTILGTRMTLQFAARLPNIRRFLHLSTSEIYGISTKGSDERAPAIIETHGERWCYAAAKTTSEFYVKAFAKNCGFQYTIVRPFNVYGPLRTGANAMSTLARQAVAGDLIRVSGKGRQTRCWCHISDFTDGLVDCLFDERAANETFNLGNDKAEITILELAKKICARAVSTSEIVVDGIMGQDVQYRRPNLRKAKRLLGYEARVGIEEGVSDVVEWIQTEGREGRKLA